MFAWLTVLVRSALPIAIAEPPRALPASAPAPPVPVWAVTAIVSFAAVLVVSAVRLAAVWRRSAALTGRRVVAIGAGCGLAVASIAAIAGVLTGGLTRARRR